MSKLESRKPLLIADFCKVGGFMGFGLFSVVYRAFFVLVWVFFIMDFGVVGQRTDAEDGSFQGVSK